MSALGSADLQNSTRENSGFQTDQATGRIIFPPLSEKLSVDKELNLSRNTIKQLIDDFFEHKTITSLSQLTTTHPFPTPHLLAQFASKAYTDYKAGETDAQYDRRLDLPDGWKLLTTASNSSMTNGYFGAAYWHPEHQQVVIAHRGTDPTNVGALWTDLNGVWRNQYVRQIGSAATFVHRVVTVLREVEWEKRVSFQLFFTGHSLGGWLAQITTFTSEYLQPEFDVFLKTNTNQDRFHPHTVVFDSPGCKEMLSDMTDILDVRLDERSIYLEHLDITSYLSAPNLINTCNKHVGTVYRIFPDLSDMCWWARNTAYYTIATHSMQKIVEVFDPETGQVRRDEQGKPKAQLVIDWPSSTGINGDKEYKEFFDWAKHLNNYHPDVTDESFQGLYYLPIRYQTKLYEEHMNSLKIFNEEEQEFLQCYRCLREWPEYFKPTELFSVMEDNQAQQEAVRKLQSFEFENDKIHCEDASALQAFIPYMKRLIQLFPEVKKKTKRAMPSDKVRNRVYQFETKRYLEEIIGSPLKFKLDALNFKDLLQGDRQVLQLQTPDGEEWTGLIKVHQYLKSIGYFTECQYTILKLKRFLTVNRFMDLSKLMQSTGTPHLLLMACEKIQQLSEENKDMIRTLFTTIQQKPNIKFIYTTQSESKTSNFLEYAGRNTFGNGFDTKDEQLTWNDITILSQEELLEKSVKFQGAEISLKKLMSAESSAAQYLPLHVLLEENYLKIADPVPISQGYNENYYIEETLLHQIAIKHNIFSDKRVKSSDLYLAQSEQKYKELCQLNPNSNVHWLEKDESGKFLWQKSQGSLETPREFIDTESSKKYTHENLVMLLEQAEKQREILISDTAGMGKSTLLTHMSKQIKKKFPNKWVVIIDLNDHTDALNALEQEKIDKGKAIEFVSEKVLKLKPGLEMELFKQGCEQGCKQEQTLRIVIMLDGFDEISPLYKQTVIDLMQSLRQTAVEQLWVTTRPNMRRELEDHLHQLSYKIETFSWEKQVEFLTKFWGLQDWYAKMENTRKVEAEKKLKIYAEELIKKLADSIGDKDKQFTGIPLQCRMLAEAFDEEVNKFCQSSPDCKPDLSFKLDLCLLYKRFIDRKYEIYQEKCKFPQTNVGAIEQGVCFSDMMTEDHQLLALNVLFTEEDVKLFQSNVQYRFSPEQLSRNGIAELNYEGKLRFIHRTFAEYYVADFFVDHYMKRSGTSKKVMDYVLKTIFVKDHHKVVRKFMDVLMAKPETEKEVLKEYGNRIRDLREDCVQVLNQAARDGNGHITGFLFDSLNVAGHKDTLIELLLAQDNDRQAVWHLAVLWGNMEVLQKLWECAKNNLSRGQIINDFLLATDTRQMTAWHVAADEGNLQILQQLWMWAEEWLEVEELNNNLLLAKDSRGKIAWHMAAKSGKTEVLEKIWEYAKERIQGEEELNNKLLLATDKLQQTAWHYATWVENLPLLQKLWELAKTNLTTPDLSSKFLLAKDKKGQTVWHMAADRGNLEVLEKIWEWASEIKTQENLNSKLMLETDKRDRTAWHVAAECGKLKLLQKQWEWAKEKLTTEDITDNLLLTIDDHEQTFLHAAAKGTTEKEFEEIWDWVTGNLNQKDIKKLLLAKDDHEQTVKKLVEKKCTKVLDKMRDWAKTFLTPEEKRSLFGQGR